MHHKSRRQFLTSSAALAAAPLLAGVAGNAIAQAPGRKLGVALCGLGSLSTNQIAPALLKIAARAKGRGNRVLKHTCHIYMTVGD